MLQSPLRRVEEGGGGGVIGTKIGKGEIGEVGPEEGNAIRGGGHVEDEMGEDAGGECEGELGGVRLMLFEEVGEEEIEYERCDDEEEEAVGEGAMGFQANRPVEEKIGIGKYSPNEEEEPAEMMQLCVGYFFVDFSRYPGAK